MEIECLKSMFEINEKIAPGRLACVEAGRLIAQGKTIILVYTDYDWKTIVRAYQYTPLLNNTELLPRKCLERRDLLSFEKNIAYIELEVQSSDHTAAYFAYISPRDMLGPYLAKKEA